MICACYAFYFYIVTPFLQQFKNSGIKISEEGTIPPQIKGNAPSVDSGGFFIARKKEGGKQYGVKNHTQAVGQGKQTHS